MKSHLYLHFPSDKLAAPNNDNAPATKGSTTQDASNTTLTSSVRRSPSPTIEELEPPSRDDAHIASGNPPRSCVSDSTLTDISEAVPSCSLTHSSTLHGDGLQDRAVTVASNVGTKTNKRKSNSRSDEDAQGDVRSSPPDIGSSARRSTRSTGITQSTKTSEKTRGARSTEKKVQSKAQKTQKGREHVTLSDGRCGTIRRLRFVSLHLFACRSLN